MKKDFCKLYIVKYWKIITWLFSQEICIKLKNSAKSKLTNWYKWINVNEFQQIVFNSSIGIKQYYQILHLPGIPSTLYLKIYSNIINSVYKQFKHNTITIDNLVNNISMNVWLEFEQHSFLLLTQLVDIYHQ